MQYFLLLLIHVQVQCDLAITRNACVNVCLLNYLNLFLKFKIVCFGSLCLTFFLMKDVFESLKCCLDHWLYSMLDCIHICVFLFLKNYFYAISIVAGHLSTVRLSTKLFSFFISHS